MPKHLQFNKQLFELTLQFKSLMMKSSPDSVRYVHGSKHTPLVTTLLIKQRLWLNVKVTTTSWPI